MHVVISISTLPKHLGRIPFKTGPYLIGNLLYNLIRWKLVPQKLKNGFTASDERWHVHSVTPTDENRLCPMSIRALC